MPNHCLGAVQGEVELVCRLCAGPLTKKFNLIVLQKYTVDYFFCAGCHSLQTEKPYWLGEAYGENNLSSLDTGAAQRNFYNLAASYGISKLFGVKNAIDIGGGDGLLCRLLRDYEVNCYVTDKYASPVYAQGFTDPDFDKPEIVLGFEVLEHFADPVVDLVDVFKHQSKVILLSTELFWGQQKDWWYLVPDSGQHVFFYSAKSLELLAERYGYTVLARGGFVLFIRPDVSAIKRWIAGLLLSSRVCRLIKVLMAILPARGVAVDHSFQIEQSKLRHK